MFTDNKYTKWYCHIINRAISENRSRQNGYYENHHIHPKCMGGSNKKENLVLLTAREHYICHILLMKMVICTKHQFQMCAAFLYMSKVRNNSTRRRYNSRLYEYHKKIRTKIQSEKFSGTGNNNYGKTHSETTRAKISAARKGINTNTPEALERKRQQFIRNNPNDDPVVKANRIEKQSRNWLVTDPTGKSYVIKNMSKFCKENDLSPGNMTMVAQGRYKTTKGWKCCYI